MYFLYIAGGSYLERLEGEGPAEVSVGVRGVLSDDDVEVGYCFLVQFNHLVGLGPLMDVPKVAWDFLNAARVGEDRLLELL